MRADDTEWTKLSSSKLAKESRKQAALLLELASAWWFDRFGYYEVIVDFGYILHPRGINWTDTYNN